MPRTSEPGASVSARLLRVLFAFLPDRRTLGLEELARRAGLPRTTTYRLAGELVEAGALQRRTDGDYTVGLALWRLGILAPQAESLRSVALPFMEDLYSALRQHVQLAVLEGDSPVIVERLSAPRAIGIVSRVGGRLPLTASAGGKVLLAHREPDFIERVLAGPLPSFTPRTITDPAVLREQLAACRRAGTAEVRSELTPDTDSVGARIVNEGGRVVAALSVVVAAGSVQLQQALPSVIAASLGISRRLGWRPGVRVRVG